jgi:hypothetical protein
LAWKEVIGGYWKDNLGSIKDGRLHDSLAWLELGSTGNSLEEYKEHLEIAVLLANVLSGPRFASFWHGSASLEAVSSK